MKIPMHMPSPAIDFCPFMKLLDKKYGFRHRDMAGKFSAEARKEEQAALETWLKENGYEGKAYVLDVPKGSQKDWPVDSPEMALRIEINTKWTPISKKHERPYQDVWHWMLDHAFGEFRRGGTNTLDLDYFLEDDSVPDYVRTVLEAIKTEVQSNPAYHDGVVNFHIDW